MRNKLLALTLVLVIVVLTLASCGEYSYLDDNMSGYTTVDTVKLKAALGGLKITDGDFTAAERDNIISDETYTALAKAVKDYVGATNAKIGDHDTVSYCAYYTVNDKDGNLHTVVITMDSDKAKSLQLGLSTNDALTTAIATALSAEYKETAFEGLTSTAPSYTVTYTKQVGEAEATTETKAVSEVDSALAEAIKAAPHANGTATVDTVSSTEEETTTTYSDINVTYTCGEADMMIVADYTVITGEGEEATEVKYTDAPIVIKAGDFFDGKNLFEIADEGNMKDVKVSAVLTGSCAAVDCDITGTDTIKDIAGNTVELGDDKKATYYIYPVSVIATPEKTAANILVYCIGTSLSTSSLACLAEDDVKDLVTDLIADSNKLISAFLTADKNYNKDASEDNKKTYDDAKTALDAKLTPVTDKAGEKICKQYLFDAKQSAYNTAVKSAVIKAVYDIISSKDYFTDSGKLPEKAVDDQYDQILGNYKKDLYGSDNSATYAKYADKLNPFESYLMDETKTSSFAAAKDAVRAEAKEYVTAIVHIYAVAEALGCEYTADEFKKYQQEEPADGYSYNDYMTSINKGYSDADVMTAKQFDKIMNTIISSSVNDAGDIEFKSSFIPALAEMIKK